jgi:hypothetical protein
MGSQVAPGGATFNPPMLFAQADVDARGAPDAQSTAASTENETEGTATEPEQLPDAPVICACVPIESLEQYDAVVVLEPVLKATAFN